MIFPRIIKQKYYKSEGFGTCMVHHILFNPRKAQRHPLEFMLIAIFYSSLSVIIGSWIFPEYASLIIVALSVFSCLYVVQGAIRAEEAKERNYKTEGWLLQRHKKTLKFLLLLFIGFVISFALWTFFLPTDQISTLFSLQDSTVENVKASVGTGSAVNQGSLLTIIGNNLKVSFISLIFALLYGAGALFIIIWNASVMGFVIGDLARNAFGIASLPIAFIKYFVHGIPEVLAYLTMALAGGIIYVAAWEGDFHDPGRRKTIIRDTLTLVLISVGLILISALIEVFITPLI